MTKKTTGTKVRSADADSDAVRLGPLEGAIGFHLRRAQEASFAAFSRRTHQQQLRAGKYAILQLLAENPGINQTALSRASGRDKSTLTATLRELEKSDLIARRRLQHDGRTSALQLTPKGEAQLHALTAHARRHDAQLDKIVGPERREEFIATLRAIAAAFGGTGARGGR